MNRTARTTKDWRWFLRPYFRYWLRYYFREFRSEAWYRNLAEVPLLLASNHPNAFLDGILLAVLFPRPLHILARGDAFSHPLAAFLLRRLGVLPVYRLSEGKRWIPKNQQSFQACLDLFDAGGSVLLFAEGTSEHGSRLRPLKKGVARLAWQSWTSEGTSRHLRVLPLGIWYEGYGAAGYGVALGSASWMSAPSTEALASEGAFIRQFNGRLERGMEQALQQAAGLGSAARLPARRSRLVRWAGWLGFAGLLPFTGLIRLTAYLGSRREPVFRGSLELSGLLVGFPLWLLALAGLCRGLHGSWALTAAVLAFSLLSLPLAAARHGRLGEPVFPSPGL